MASRKLWAASIALVFLVLGFAFIRVQAAANDSSVNLKKDTATGLFVLTVRDPDGILEFSITPVGKLPYGGGMSGCNKSFTNNTASFADPDDFTPAMTARIIDCKNNTTELEIPPPVDGITRSIAVKTEEPPPPPPPSPAKEAKTTGPLSADDIQYPVAVLGNCQSEAQCRTYCDIVDNAPECFTFAKKYHLISEEEAKKDEDRFLNINNGPGGCNSGKSCEGYCNNVDHLDACIAFAEKTGYYSPEQLAEARKFQALVKAGTPFPGGCTDRNTCEVYCGDPNHIEECLDFAEKSGFLPQEEIEQARKILPLMKRGETPGGCTSKEQCEKYCSVDDHADECIAFGEKAGLISPEDAAMIKKTGGKGPGGCRSRGQCDAYCETNSEECFNWAKDNGLISEDDLKKMTEGMKQFRDELDKMPPEAVACMKEAAGEENFNKMAAGEPVFDRGLEGKMKSCFSQVTNDFGQRLSDIPPEAAQCIINAIGEDGLQKLKSGELDKDLDFGSLQSCFEKLQSSFGGGRGGPGGPGGSNFDQGGFSGPGGCTNTAECTTFCRANPQECRGFGPPGGGGEGGDRSRPSSSEPPSSGVAPHPASVDSSLPTLPDSGPYAYKPPTKPQSCVADSFSLVSWWNGYREQPTNTSRYTAVDISDGNNGIIMSSSASPAPISGKVGEAFSFADGWRGIATQNSGNLNFGTGPFSLEAWFKWEGGGNVNNIIRKSTAHTGAGYWLRINQSTKLLEFFVGDTSDDPAKPRGLIEMPVVPGIWYHVIATRRSSGTMKLYMNGEIKGSKEAPGANATSESPFTIGAWKSSSEFGADTSEIFNGMIDEVSVYDKELSASEVGSIFNLGSEGKCTRHVEYPVTSEQAKSAYWEQQQAYQSYLGQQKRSTSCTSDEYWNGSYCAAIPQGPRCGEKEYWDGASCIFYDPNAPRVIINGPGGCTTREECIAYCAPRHPSPECEGYPAPAPSPTPSGGTESQPPATNYSGPGGCTTTAECQTYCTAHYTDPACQQMGPSGFNAPTESRFATDESVYPGATLGSSLANLFAPFINLLR